MKYQLAIFASGSGTNTETITRYFENHDSISVKCILCNNPKALVLERANRLGIPSMVFTRAEFYSNESVVSFLQERAISHIVLAGFLWLIPAPLLSAFTNRIINIHPALLPLHGGKGMYGMKVHEAVRLAGDKETGITIHEVNEKYDEGRTLFQARVEVSSNDSAETIATKVHELEYKHYPQVIEKWVLNKLKD